MEFPDFGKNCSQEFCNQLDFLPMKCDACARIFCKNHFTYNRHACPSCCKKDIQIPVCALCNKPIGSGYLSDKQINQHKHGHCHFDHANLEKITYSHQCTFKGCKRRELVDVVCPVCRRNFCLKHRNQLDHDCSGQMTKNDDSKERNRPISMKDPKNIGELGLNQETDWKRGSKKMKCVVVASIVVIVVVMIIAVIVIIVTNSKKN